jgi:hypothetical protein
VLVSPVAITGSSASEKAFLSTLTRELVKNSPDIDTDKPVSRQHELRHLDYYGHPKYWEGVGIAGGIYPSWITGFHDHDNAVKDPWLQPDCTRTADEFNQDANAHPHLRSCNAVLQYHIHASDGDIGHVTGMLIEEESWAVCYIVVNTSSWWLGHQVLIAPPWIQNVSWPDRTVTVDLDRQAVRLAPPYDSSVPLDPDMELRIFEHYGRDIIRAGAGSVKGRASGLLDKLR